MWDCRKLHDFRYNSITKTNLFGWLSWIQWITLEEYSHLYDNQSKLIDIPCHLQFVYVINKSKITQNMIELHFFRMMKTSTISFDHHLNDYQRNKDINSKRNMSFVPMPFRRCPISIVPAFECLRRRLVVIMLLLFNIAQANYISRGKSISL